MATHRRMPVRLHQKARPKSGRHAQRQRPIHRIRHQLRAIPIRTQRHRNRPILRMQPQLAARPGKADRPILRRNVRLARAILHANRPVRRTRGDLPVHAVKAHRPVMRRHFNIRRPWRANQQEHRPLVALAMRPTHRNLAALHRQLDLRQKPRRISAHRRLTRRHRVRILIPSPHLHPAVFHFVHPQHSSLCLRQRPLFGLDRRPLVIQPDVQVRAIRRRPVAPMRGPGVFVPPSRDSGRRRSCRLGRRRWQRRHRWKRHTCWFRKLAARLSPNPCQWQ